MAHSIQAKAEQLCRDDIRRQLIRAGNNHACLDGIAANRANAYHGGMAHSDGQLRGNKQAKTAMLCFVCNRGRA